MLQPYLLLTLSSKICKADQPSVNNPLTPGPTPHRATCVPFPNNAVRCPNGTAPPGSVNGPGQGFNKHREDDGSSKPHLRPKFSRFGACVPAVLEHVMHFGDAL